MSDATLRVVSVCSLRYLVVDDLRSIAVVPKTYMTAFLERFNLETLKPSSSKVLSFR